MVLDLTARLHVKRQKVLHCGTCDVFLGAKRCKHRANAAICKVFRQLPKRMPVLVAFSKTSANNSESGLFFDFIPATSESH